MADNFRLLPERPTVLVQVRPAQRSSPIIPPDLAALPSAVVDDDIGKVQVSPLAGGPIQLDTSHDNRRIHRAVRQHGITVLVRVVDVVGCAFGDIKEVGLARDSVMGASSSQQMAHRVQFMVVMKREPFEVAQSDLRGDIAVRLLRFGNHRDDPVHLLQQRRIARLRVDIARRFQPLVDPSVLPIAAFRLAFLLAGSDEHIVPSPVVCQFPQSRQGYVPRRLRLLLPESVRPTNPAQIDAVESRVRTVHGSDDASAAVVIAIRRWTR